MNIVGLVDSCEWMGHIPCRHRSQGTTFTRVGGHLQFHGRCVALLNNEFIADPSWENGLWIWSLSRTDPKKKRVNAVESYRRDRSYWNATFQFRELATPTDLLFICNSWKKGNSAAAVGVKTNRWRLRSPRHTLTWNRQLNELNEPTIHVWSTAIHRLSS